MGRFYRTFSIDGGEDKEFCVDADCELDAETEFDAIQTDLEVGEHDVEATSPIYTLKDKFQNEERK